MYIICLTRLKLMMWVLICCLSQTAHFNIQLYLRKIERCFSFASNTCSFDTCCSASSLTLPHPFIHSLIHSFIHSLWQWIWTSDWVRGVGCKNEKRRKGREGALFFPLSLLSDLATLQRARRPSPFPPVSSTLGILSYTLSICSFEVSTAMSEGRQGERRHKSTHLPSPAVWFVFSPPCIPSLKGYQ